MDTRCIVVQRWGSATREAEKERRGEGVESSSAASALWRSNIQTSRSFAVCQILSSAPIGARVPLILLRRLFLHLLLWSRSKSTLPPPPPPLRRVSPSPSLSLSPLHRRYQSAYVADWCQCWLVLQVTMTSLPLLLSPIPICFSLSLPLFPCISCFLVGSLGFRCIYKDTRMGERKR